MDRPLPRPTADTRNFWDGCTEGIVRYQSCTACGKVQIIPRSLCESCQSNKLVWRASSGLGRILSHTTVYRAPTPAFRDEAPYVIAIVDMNEGFRLMVNVKGGEASKVVIGSPVRIGFRVIDGIALPHAEVIE